MPADPILQTHTPNGSLTTTYTRTDLEIVTAAIEPSESSPWVARLYYGPEPDECNVVAAADREEADNIAIGYSLVADSAPRPA